MKKFSSVKELEDRRKEILKNQDPEKSCITICCGTGCRAYGAEEVANEFIAEKDRRGLIEKIDIKSTGCHGFCERGPLVVIHPKKIFYQHVTKDDVGEIDFITGDFTSNGIDNRTINPSIPVGSTLLEVMAINKDQSAYSHWIAGNPNSHLNGAGSIGIEANATNRFSISGLNFVVGTNGTNGGASFVGWIVKFRKP